ncbi:hypothetical protein LDFHOB_11090 [Candidatus Electronema aureum]
MNNCLHIQLSGYSLAEKYTPCISAANSRDFGDRGSGGDAELCGKIVKNGHLIINEVFSERKNKKSECLPELFSTSNRCCK